MLSQAQSLVRRAHLPPADGAGEARHRNRRAAARRAAAGHPAAGGGAGDQPQHGGQGLSRARARRRHRAAAGRRRVRLGQGADRRRTPTSCARRRPRSRPRIEKLRARGVTDEEIRRLFEAELAGMAKSGGSRGGGNVVSDRLVIETADLWKRYDDVEALRGLDLAGAGGIDLRLPRQERRRQDDDDQGPARHGAADQRRGARASARAGRATPASRSAGAPRFVSDEKDLYDYMTVGEMIPFTRPFYPQWRADLEQQYLPQVRAAGRPRHQGPVARHAHQARAAAGAVPRRRAADPRRADLGPRSGDGRRRAAGARRPRRRRGDRRCSSRRTRSPKSIRSPITSRSSIAAGRCVAGALDDLRAQYQRVQLVFEGDAPDVTFHAPGVHRVQRAGPRAHRATPRRRAR